MSSFSTMSDGKRKALLIFLSVIFVGCFGVVSIADLVNTKDRYTVNLGECYELMEIEHSINGLIPVGKDQYYIDPATHTLITGFFPIGTAVYCFDPDTGKMLKNTVVPYEGIPFSIGPDGIVILPQ